MPESIGIWQAKVNQKFMEAYRSYLIFVTSTTNGAGVKNFSLVSKTPELTLKMFVLHTLAEITEFQNCGYLYLKAENQLL